MSREAALVIPSAGRADIVKTTRMVLKPEMAVLCVPESEGDAYRKHNPDTEIVTHPDSIRGLPRKRQFIYDKFGDVIMLDDDLVVAYHFEHRPGEPTCKMTPDETHSVLQRLADNARDLGVFLFGLSPYPDIRNYAPQWPFAVTGFVMGGTMGMLRGSKLTFSDAVIAADDYWISCLNAYHHRMALIDFRYKVTSKSATFHGRGGTSSLRTLETEARDTAALRKYFGSDVIRKKHRSARSQGLNHGHKAQRTMSLPF